MTQELSLESRQKRGLIFGLLSGPVTYMVHFLLVYFLAEGGCRAGLARVQWFGWNAIYVGVIALTLVAAAITAGATLYCYRRWQQYKEYDDTDPEAYPRFLSLAGLLLNGYHTIVILLTGLPVPMLVLCEWT